MFTNRFLTATLCLAISATSFLAAAQEGTQGSSAEEPLFAGRSFDVWSHLLKVDLDEATRRQAVQAIGALGRQGRHDDALSILLPLARSQDASLAIPSHYALARLSTEGVKELIGLLREDDYPYRENIVRALKDAGPIAEPAVESLITLLHSADIELRRRSFEALLAIGKPGGDIIAALEGEISRNDDPHTLQIIFFGLVESPLAYEDKEQFLISSMQSSNRNVVQSATSALAMCGKSNEAVRTALGKAIRDYAADPKRSGACPNIQGKGANVQLLLPILLEVVAEQNLNYSNVRNGIFLKRFVDDVSELGTSAKPAVVHFLKILKTRQEPLLSPLEMEIVRKLPDMDDNGNESLNALETIAKDLRKVATEPNTYEQRNKDFQLDLTAKAIERIRLRKSTRSAD